MGRAPSLRAGQTRAARRARGVVALGFALEACQVRAAGVCGRVRLHAVAGVRGLVVVVGVGVQLHCRMRARPAVAVVLLRGGGGVRSLVVVVGMVVQPHLRMRARPVAGSARAQSR